jgi:hypothetical protein
VRQAITVDASLGARAVTGGTAHAAVKQQLAVARAVIAKGDAR